MLTENVRLLQGVKYEGKTHRDVVLRTPIVRDALEAEQECEGKSTLTLSLCLMSKRITAFGTVPKDQINAELLAELSDEDFERLQTATEYLKKKALWQNDV